MALAVIGLGSNLGDRDAMLVAAVEALADHGEIVALSRVYETEPEGGPPQGPFLNAAVAIETALEPEELLDLLQSIEARLGRVRSVRWGPRTIDLDLLTYDDLQIDTPRLQLPHPRLLDRSFARYPAAEVGAPIQAGSPPGPVRPFQQVRAIVR